MMNRKDCRSARQEIDESELGQSLSDQARSHVIACPSCRGFQAERTSLRELVGSLEPVSAPGDFELRLRAHMASERQSRPQWPSLFRLITSTPGIAVAALVVMLAMSLVWYAQRKGIQTAAPTASSLIKEAPDASHQDQIAVNTQIEPAKSAAPSKPNEAVDGSHPGRPGDSVREKNNKLAQSEIKVTDYGVSPAEIVRQGQQRSGEVSLIAPLNPMVVSMQDDHGTTRRISLPPVSFGAQRLVDNRVPVTFSPNSRSW
jgi:hypothetical protein